MIVVLTELFETAPEASTFLIDTEKLSPVVRNVIESARKRAYGHEYITGLSGYDGESFSDAVVDVPFTGTVDRVVLFYWE